MPIAEGIQYTISSLCDFFSRMLREPRPWYEDIGEEICIGAFLAGLSEMAFDFLKVMYDSPKGQRLSGSFNVVSNNGRNLPEDICNSVVGVAAAAFGVIQWIRSRETCSAARSSLYGVLLFGLFKLVDAFVETEGKAKGKKATE